MLRSKSFEKKGIIVMMMMALLALSLSIAIVHSSPTPTDEEVAAITSIASNNNNNTIITTDAKTKSKIVSVLCPTDHEMVYNFKASTLLGTKPHLQSVSAIKNGSSQENTLMGKMTLTCAGSTTKKNLIAVSFPSVQYLQFQGMKKYGNLGKKDVNFWFNKKYRTLQKRRNLTKAMNKYPLAIVRSKTGQVSKMIFHKREPFWLKSIKKGLVRVLTTETKRVQRKQTDGFGSAYTQKFNKTKSPKKKVTQVIQKFSEKDFKKISPKKRTIGYEGSHLVKINKKGLITRALMGTRITMGKRPALPSFKKFEKETGKKKKFVTKNKDQVQTLHISSLKLNKVIKKKKADLPKIISKFFNVAKGSVAVKPQFIIIKTFGMTKQDRKDAKKMISKTFKPKNLKKLLSSVKKDFKDVSPVTNKKLSKVAQYVSKSPVKASKVLMTELMKGVLALKKISPTEPVTKKIIPYIESVQSLVASVNNTKVQDKLAKISKIHPVLANNYPYASILIKKPTKEVVTFLKQLKTHHSNSTKHSISKTNAFLAYADLADRSTDATITKEIVGEIISALMGATSQESFLTAIHALNNAGKGVPLSIIKSVLLSEKMPESIKNMITENLKKRVGDIKVDELIHSLIKSKRLSESVIASLISAQTDREGLLKNGTSVQQFASLLKKNPSDLIKNAIKQYLYTVGTEESAKELEQSYEQTTEMITQSDIEDEGVTLELNEEESNAKSKVEQVAEKIKSYFESANWNGAKSTCLAASKTEKMCIYNNEMLNFVRKQGDLSTISKSKFYSYENKFGTNGINIYTGFVVYGGASFDCSKSSAFDAVFFGRAAAEANLFDNTYPVASAYAELNNRDASSINNRVFVKLFTTTFVDKQFLPSVTTCTSETKNILTKAIPNLIKTSYTITVGPVPITFSFGVGISYGVDLKYAYCLNSFSASLSLEPTLVADITGSADVGIPLAKATVAISASATTRGIPELSFSSCNLCATLSYKLESANFEATLKGKVAVWEKSWTLYTYTLPIAYSKQLYQQCVNTKLPTI
ncbi:predicted protein [Naegleria gruberi]|uniref:Predicted protein n=1 Tax=Naegleria gruberi TaxID=5762 RepID=D2W290_NAEGR|nr:uncharacterized protein NAEGRDRAFT_82118 [Naegleria gruberi]EFC36822.1 predicted protein [Naegleria gruberi]|eukprot:XP_002669566.1 predicted protein [Naegleria gruberi strain NEG-M]